MNKSVRFADAIEQGGWTHIPNVVLLDPKLSCGAKVVYAALIHYARQDETCWPGQERLCTELAVTDKTLRGYITELSTGKLIEVHKPGQGHTNRYTLLSLNRRYSGSARGETPVEVEAVEEDKPKPPPGDKLALVVVEKGLAPATAQTLTAFYVDEAKERGVTPPKRTVGIVARYVKELLDEGFPPEQVKLGIMQMLDRRVVQPAMLGQFVMEAVLPPRRRKTVSTPEHLTPEAMRARSEQLRQEHLQRGGS